MTWNYRAIKETSEGETNYQVYECYYDHKGALEGWTEEPVYPQGETLAELREDLEAMLHDVESRPVLDMEELRKRFPNKQEGAP